MDKYELNYGEGKVYAIEQNGGYIIGLPEKVEVDDDITQASIHIIPNRGIVYQGRSKKGEPKNSWNIWLQNDGKITYVSEATRGKPKTISLTEKTYEIADTYAQSVSTVMQKLNEQLVAIQQTVEGYKRIRNVDLNLQLRRLGFESPQAVLSGLSQYSGICNLSEIADELEDSRYLSEIEGFSRRDENGDMIYSYPDENAMQILSRLSDETYKKLERQVIQEGIAEDRKFSEDDEKTEAQKVATEWFNKGDIAPEQLTGGFLIRKRDFTSLYETQFLRRTDPVKTDGYAENMPGRICRSSGELREYETQVIDTAKYYVLEDDEKKAGVSPEESKLPKVRPTTPLDTPGIKRDLLYPKNWDMYSAQVKKIALLYLALNSDLLEPEVAEQVMAEIDQNAADRIKELIKMPKQQRNVMRGDIIADLITNNNQFNEAAYLENLYMCDVEIDFLEKVERFIGDGASDFMMGGFGESIGELKTHSIDNMRTRLEHIERYKKGKQQEAIFEQIIERHKGNASIPVRMATPPRRDDKKVYPDFCD